MLKYLSPVFDIESESASVAPGRFLVRVFIKYAATMALVLAVFDAFRSQPINEEPRSRLLFIVVWSVMMAAISFWAARQLNSRRARA
jgi:hypothetical protein